MNDLGTVLGNGHVNISRLWLLVRLWLYDSSLVDMVDMTEMVVSPGKPGDDDVIGNSGRGDCVGDGVMLLLRESLKFGINGK